MTRLTSRNSSESTWVAGICDTYLEPAKEIPVAIYRLKSRTIWARLLDRHISLRKVSLKVFDRRRVLKRLCRGSTLCGGPILPPPSVCCALHVPLQLSDAQYQSAAT